MSVLARMERFGEKDPFFKKWRSCSHCFYKVNGLYYKIEEIASIVFRISFSDCLWANTTDADPGMSRLSKYWEKCQEFKKKWWLTIPLTLSKIKNHYRKTYCLSKDLCTPLYNGSIHCHHRICQHKSKNYRDHDLSQAWP